MTQLLRDDEVLWLIVDVPEESEFLQGSKSKIDFRSFHQTDPRRCRRSWPTSNGRPKRNGNCSILRPLLHRMIAMKTLIAHGALLLLFNVIAHGQEESASPAPEKKSYPEIPKGYEVGEQTISPDGRFALVYPMQDPDTLEVAQLPNLLVRLKPYKVLLEIDESAPLGRRGAPAAEWNGNEFVAVWRQMKWGNEDLVVYQIANDKIKREEKIWPDVVKYFDRDFKARFLKKYPDEDGYTFVSDEDRAKEIEFKDRKLILNIFAENKPNLAPGPVWSAELHAVWDLDKAKFDKVDFKPGEISVRKPEG